MLHSHHDDSYIYSSIKKSQILYKHGRSITCTLISLVCLNFFWAIITLQYNRSRTSYPINTQSEPRVQIITITKPMILHKWIQVCINRLELCGSKNFILVPGFLEWKNLGSVRLFSKKKNSTNVWTHLCMFRAFLLNRWIYAFVSFYKSLNILIFKRTIGIYLHVWTWNISF